MENNISRLWIACSMTMCILIGGAVSASAASVTFTGNSLKAQEVKPEANTGLDCIYVLYDVKGVSATFTDSQASGSNTKWYRFSNLGGGYAEEVPGITYSGTSSTLSNLEGDMGYIVEFGTSRYYFWVVDYLHHRLSLKHIAPVAEQSCDNTQLALDYSGTPIHYYTINGRQNTLDQQLTLSYYNLEWNDADKIWNQVPKDLNLDHPQEVLTIYPPVLCNTTFSLSGDRFLKGWNWGEQIESDTFHPVAVDARTEAIQCEQGVSATPSQKKVKSIASVVRNKRTRADEEPTETEEEEEYKSNIMHGETPGLGGSAPCDISFYAYVTDAVIHHEWQMSSDPNFEDVQYRFNQQDLQYTFMEEGTMYLRYIGSNADGSCETIGETYQVNIGASDLWCPNAFSPGASKGVNDMWKVAYRSLVEFKCWIFDRYGTEMYHYTDPNGGWDGTYKGKLVKPGVYFYVIEAVGADGKKYKKSGDINIVGYRLRESNTATQ